MKKFIIFFVILLIGTIGVFLPIQNLPQNVQPVFAAPTCTGTSFMIVYDISDSMRHSFSGGGSKKAEAQKDTKNYINKINFSIDSVGLVFFAENARLERSLGSSKSSLLSSLTSYRNEFGTSIDYALQRGYSAMSSAPASNRRYMILITDGQHSYTFGRSASEKDKAAIDTANKIKGRGTTLIVLGLSGADANLLDKLASPGQSYYANSANQLLNFYNTIASGTICTNTPTPTLPPTYTIRGNVFNDTNKNRIKDAGESNYTGGVSISASSGTVTNNANGSYVISNLTAGRYTISYSSLPAGYKLVYPVNGPPPSFSVVVGSGCSVDGTTGASCTSGNVTNLNFAITNSIAWIQSYGLDTRFDNGYTSQIPTAPTCAPYALLTSPDTTTPGILFTGDALASFGEGQASSKNWISGGLTYPEIFSSGSISPTSYNSLLGKANRTGQTITDLPCTLSKCTLPANLDEGVYQANGDVELNAYTFNVNRKYVFLINGTLRINGQIQVQNGSVVFSAKNNIVVDQSVGAAANVCPIPDGQIQGLFSADNNITIDGANDCLVSSDKMLNVEGSFIVNANGTGGSFTNNRDLCGDNPDVPSFTIKDRLDLLLNAPSLLLKQSVIFHEDAP